jgi:hypothetical protein
LKWKYCGRPGPIDEQIIDNMANEIKQWKTYKQLDLKP